MTSRLQGRGFTLMELLVVIAILGLIAGVAGPAVIKQFNSSKVETTRLQLQEFSSILDVFYLSVGRYPTTTEGLESLITNPSNTVNWNGPYLKGSEVPVDAWGNAFIYTFPGEHGLYDLYSLGADGKTGGEGDNADLYANI